MAMRDAKLLHKYSSLTCKGAQEVLADVKDKFSWNENENILDIGCGTGNLTVNVLTDFVPADSTIIGADISDEVINFAKCLYTHPRITFKKMDILDDNLWPTWKKEHFSKIFSFYVMHRIKDDRKAYINMFNLLKPGGEVLIMVPVTHAGDAIAPHLAKMSKYSKYAEELSEITFYIAPRQDQVSYNHDLFKTLGFDVLLCKSKVMCCSVPSVNNFIEKYGLVSRLPQILPQDLFKEALEDSKRIVEDNQLLEQCKDGFLFKYTVMAINDAETYHILTPFTCLAARVVLIDVKNKFTWNENENILDIGCGSGNVTVNVLTEFVPDDSKIIGADISDDMIKFAQNLYSHPRITFKKMDILDDNLWRSWYKGQFSKIVNFHLMPRIKDSRKAYNNMYDLLQPGGEALLMFPIKHVLDKITPHLARLSKYSKYAEELSKMSFHFAPREDHVSFNCDLLKTLGFDLILCKEKVISHTMPSIPCFVELYGTITPLSQILPQDLLQQALEDAKRIVKDNKILEESENGVTVNYTALIIIVKKPF